MPRIPDGFWELASTQQSLIRRSQALQFVDEKSLARLLAPEGPCQYVLRGVYATFTGELTDKQRRHAALLYVAEEYGDGTMAVISGAAGCQLHRVRSLPADDGTIQILIQHSRRKQSRGFVRVERTTRFPERVRVIDDCPIAPVVRCIMDAARKMDDLNAVRALLTGAVQSRHVDVSMLARELREGPSAGSARPRRALNEVTMGARSAQEVPFVLLLTSSKVLPRMHFNCSLFTPKGVFLGKPDSYAEDVGLAGELQSKEYHLHPEEQEADYSRAIRFAKYGVLFAPVRPSTVRAAGQSFLADFEAIYLERKRQGISPSAAVVCRHGCPLSNIDS